MVFLITFGLSVEPLDAVVVGVEEQESVDDGIQWFIRLNQEQGWSYALPNFMTSTQRIENMTVAVNFSIPEQKQKKTAKFFSLVC